MKAAQLLIILNLVMFRTTQAQSVSGLLRDSAGPVAYNAVGLADASDSVIVKGAMTDENGRYRFLQVAPGNYLVRASNGGTFFVQSESFRVDSGKDVEISPMITRSREVELENVEVTALGKTVTFRKGNITVQVAGTALSMGNSAYDLLLRLPGVVVDNDMISIQGRQGVRLMIDGRLQQLSERQLFVLLKSMSANTIEKIEIMKNPPARVDASGTAGMINIVSKRLRARGISGSVNMAASQGFYPQGEGGFSLNYRGKHLTVFADLNGEYEKARSDMRILRKLPLADRVVSSDQSELYVEPDMGLTANLGFELETGKKMIVGGRITADPGYDHSLSGGITTFDDASAGYDRMEFGFEFPTKWLYMNYNLNALYRLDTTGSQLSMSFDLSPNSETHNAEFRNRFYGADITDFNYRFRASDRIGIFSGRADLIRKLSENMSLEAGLKHSNQQMSRDYDLENLTSSGPQKDTLFSSRFNYNEHVSAAYISFSAELESFEFTTGLRLENTILEGRGNRAGQSRSSSYLSLFPTVEMEYELSEKQSLQFNYNRRINRPNYAALNPAKVRWGNVFITERGNLWLQPEISNAFELTHVYNERISNALMYSLTDNQITNYTEVADSTRESILYNINVDRTHILGYTFSGDLKLKNWWTLTANATAAWIHTNGWVGGSRFISSTFASQLSLINAVIWKKKNRLETMLQYFGPQLEGLFYMDARWSLNIAYKRSFFREKLDVTVGVDDVFYTMVARSRFAHEGQEFTVRDRMDSRRVKLALSYNFGGKKIERREVPGNEEDREKLKH